MREVSMSKGKSNGSLQIRTWNVRMKGKAKRIWDKLLNFLFVGMCVMLLAGCGSEVEVLAPEDIKIDMQGSQAGAVTAPPETNSGQSTAAPIGSTTVAPTALPIEEPTEESTAEPTPEPVTATLVSAEEIAETRAAYKQALLTILNEWKLPDGTALYYDGYDEFSQNKFAMHDVDGDGREELIFSYNTGPMAVMGKYVYGYNAETDVIYQQAVAFSMVFYDNGMIKADLSHNHGRGEKLWPYVVYYYSSPTDDYRFGVNVDSWQKDYYGNSAQGAAFPTEADTDGDGIVYYLMAYDDYSYENPIDGAEYQEWYDGQFGNAEIIKPTYYEMTKNNIEAVGDAFAGNYVDRQGTTDIYSELQLVGQDDGTYKAIIGLYRLATLEGVAKREGDVLLFEDDIMKVKGEISIKDGNAVLTITDTSFEYISKGDVFSFPEKL